MSFYEYDLIVRFFLFFFFTGENCRRRGEWAERSCNISRNLALRYGWRSTKCLAIRRESLVSGGHILFARGGIFPRHVAIARNNNVRITSRLDRARLFFIFFRLFFRLSFFLSNRFLLTRRVTFIHLWYCQEARKIESVCQTWFSNRTAPAEAEFFALGLLLSQKFTQICVGCAACLSRCISCRPLCVLYGGGANRAF